MKFITINKQSGRCHCLILLTLLFLAWVEQAYAAEIKVESISEQEGLNSPQVYTVERDADGFIWFGTAQGVRRFDGYSMLAFSHDPDNNSTLSSNSVSAMHIDSHNYLWVGTWGGGLNLLDPDSGMFKRYQHNSRDAATISSDRVQVIFESVQGEIWIGTNGGGLNLFDEDTEQFFRFPDIREKGEVVGSNRVWDIAQESTGKLWIGTSAGLFQMQTDRTFVRYGDTEQGLGHPEVREVYVDSEDRIWVATRASFGLLDKKKDQFQVYQLPNGELPIINDITKDGDYLVLSTFAGIYKFDTVNRVFVVNAEGEYAYLNNRDVRGVSVDSQGVWWAATRYSGVKKVFTKPQAFRAYREILADQSLAGLFSQTISLAERAQGGIWLGTGRSIVAFDGEQFTSKLTQEELESFARLRILGVTQTNDKDYYLATDNGLYFFDTKNETVIRQTLPWLDNQGRIVSWVSIDQMERLWIVRPSVKNIAIWDTRRNQVSYLLDGIEPSFSYVDAQNRIWIGTTDEGLHLVDGLTLHTQVFKNDPNNPSSISHNTVTAALQSSSGDLWFATQSGLDKFNPETQQFTRFQFDVGVDGTIIQSILEDEQGVLWLGTTYGLIRYDTKQNSFQHFTRKDGLNSNSFLIRSAARGIDGQLYFGSIDGVTAFAPEQVSVNFTPPQMAITRITVDGKSHVSVPGVITLDADYRSLEIEFAAMDFFSSRNNRYRTRIIGYSDDWSDASEINRVNIGRLPPDTYRFQVVASNNHGIWNNDALALEIIVKPHWYQTWWFSLSAPLIVLLVLYRIFTGRLAKHQQQEKFLSQQVEQRAKDIFVLGDVGKDIAETFDIALVASKIHERMASSLEADVFAIGLKDPASGEVDFVLESYSAVVDAKDAATTEQLTMQNPMVKHCMEFGEEVVITQEMDWYKYIEQPTELTHQLQMQSIVCMPLIAGEECIGVITVQSQNPDAFHFSMLNVLRIVASQSALAFANCLSYAELADAEERLELAIQGANAGTWENNFDTNKVVTSDIWANMLGYTNPELFRLFSDGPNRFIHLIHPEDIDTTTELLRRHIKGETDVFRAQFRMRTAQGNWKWILSIGKKAVPTESNPHRRMFGIHLDITETKELEAKILEAKQQAESAAQAKSDFLSNMSHEIRTPMNAILGMSHLALTTELTPKQRNYIGKVYRSAESLLGIINDILDFSKIEAGKLDVESIEFNINDVFNHLTQVLELKIQQKALDLYFVVDKDVPEHMRGDPLRLGQVLLNLCSNAVKFSHKNGEIIVRLQKEVDDGDNLRLLFTVQDFGIGMSPEQVSKLFSSFSQADTSTTREYGGTGLGLTISRNLAELMGGDIWVESEQGQGSEFHFNIVVQYADMRTPVVARPADITKNLNVILIDDNDTAREILQNQLILCRYDVTGCDSGAMALDILEKRPKDQPVDLIFLDWHMPNMNGVETAKRIRAMDIQQPKIIMITGYNESDLQLEIRGLDISCTLTKPITPSALYSSIVKAMGEVESELDQEESSEKVELAKAKLSGANILLAEDNEMNQELVTDLLEMANISVTIAENGEEAIALLNEREFDGVLMDCQMPVMDGYSATRKIRVDERFSKLPIVAMTANAMAGDKEKAIAAGMNDHIAKPVKVSTMFEVMSKWISPSQPQELPASKVKSSSLSVNAQHFPSIKGVDTDAGLGTCQNNPKLYKKLLKRFTETEVLFEAKINDAFAENDYEKAAMLAHTLKGNAGNIGAHTLQHMAGSLEQACKNKAEDAQDSVADINDEIVQLVVNIKAALPEQEDTQEIEKIQVSPEQLLQNIDEIMSLLAEFDTSAEEKLELLATQLHNPELTQLVQEAIKAMDEFDFDAAKEAIEKVQTALSD
ncbi:MAG: response regulator [Alteromonadaceae bacterium]|nr:response regulator [Alteromonadaceae bacterium]